MTESTNEEFESIVLQFEQAWQNGTVPSISESLPESLTSIQRLEWLSEFIAIDLEYRWQHNQQSHVEPRSVDDYLREFPELEQSEKRYCELVCEEYRVRLRFGDSPDHSVFLSRSPEKSSEIEHRLQQIDREYEFEVDSGNLPIADDVRFLGEFDPQAPLPYRDYQLRHLIGAGRMGKVFYAWQTSLNRPVAIKYLRKTFQHDREAIDRFLNEARTVARLHHPNIVGIHGLGRTPNGGYFLVMDWVDGDDLSVALTRDSIATADAVQWIIQACQGIDAAHQLGIIHCDLKPANLLRSADNRVYVTDFGLARSLTDETRSDDGIEGTAPYMAPEQVSNYWGSISPQTDVYGLGAVLYTLLTRQPPWNGKTLADVLGQAVSASPVQSVSVLRPELSAELIAVCDRSLNNHPHQRFSTISDFRKALVEVPEIEDSTIRR